MCPNWKSLSEGKHTAQNKLSFPSLPQLDKYPYIWGPARESAALLFRAIGKMATAWLHLSGDASFLILALTEKRFT